MAPKRAREEEGGAQAQQEEVKAPRKALYRMRAHSNPLNDASFPVPLSPAHCDWVAHYPELHAKAAAAGEAPPEVDFADVGCGFGGLTVRLAEAYPDKLVLGMELRDKVTEYVKERIIALRKQHPGQYQNASVVRTNAMKFLTNYFKKGQLTKLFFLFADPHFKAANHRRRIIQRTLLAEYAYLLRPGGLLYTITDVEDLGNWQRDKLEAHPLFERVSEEELENDPAAQLLLEGTEEGQKVKRNGGKTWRHVYRRIAGPADAAAAAEGGAAAAAAEGGAAAAAAGSDAGQWCWGAAHAAAGAAQLAYLDEGCLIYPAGHSLVLYQPDARVQRLLAGGPEARPTAFAACPAKRLLALAERGPERSTITVFDAQTLKRRKVLAPPADAAKEFVAVAFSADGRLLVAQGGAPDWTLCLWAWEKAKLVASVRTVTQPGHAAVQCAFQPGDDLQLISVVGEGTCCLYQIEAGNTLRALPTALAKRESQGYTCHAWLLDGDAAGGGGEAALVVGTKRGEVLIVAQGEVKQALVLEDGAAVESLAAHSKGFVVGTSNGMLCAYERDSDSKPYRLLKSFPVPSGGSGSGAAAADAGAAAPAAAAPSAAPAVAVAAAVGAGPAPPRVCSLAVCPGDEGIACLTSDAQLLQLAVAPGARKGVFSGLQPLGPAFHAGEITGLATCVRRPVVATAGADRTLRVWNWQDKSAELVKAFDEPAHSLALHPTGYLLLAGFADKLRLMTVMSDDLRVIKELPIKAARDCCFSNGGQYFSAVNGNTVHVFDTYTCASLVVLRGHNGKVRGLWWSPDDATLITAGVDGAVYEWRVQEGRRARDFVQKGWSYTAVAGMHGSAAGAGPAAASVFVASLDKKLRLLEETTAGSGLAVTAEVEAGTVITQLVAPGPGGRLLFAATEDGSVRAYKLPLTPDFHAVRCGGAPVTRLALTRDESTLFAATADGCLHVLDVRDRDAARFLTRREGEGLPFSEEVLVGRGDIDERRERMAELEAQVAEVTAQNEYQLKLRDLALNEKVRELTDKAAAEAAAAAERYNALLADRAELEARYEARLRSAEEQASAQVVALDSQFQQKLIHDMERYQELADSKEALAARWEKQAAATAAAHAKEVEELTASHRAQLAEERSRYGSLALQKEDAAQEAAEVRRQMEEDVDREVEELKERYRKELQVEGDANLRLKGENGLLRKRFDEQLKAIEEGKGALRAAEAEKRQLQGVIEGLRRDVAALQRDVAGRDEAIAEKEKRILELKHSTQELEKFKFVLEYSIGELRAQLDPKSAELADMRGKVEDMEALVGEVGRSHADVALELEGRKQREAALHKEIARERAALAEAKHKIKQMQCGIALAVEHIQSPDQLKAAVKQLYQSHAAAAEGSKAKGAGSSAAEAAAAGSDGAQAGADAASQRQIATLQHSVEQLRAALEAEKRSAAANHRRMVAENAELIARLREYARRLAQGLPLVGGLQGGNIARIVVRLRPGAHCAVQWRMTHLLCPLGASVGSIAQMQCGIALAVEHIQSPDQLKAAVKQLYQSHAAAAEGSKAKGAGSSAAEAAAAGSDGAQAGADAASQRQIATLQHSVEQLRAALEAEKRSAAANHRRMVAENAELIARLREVQGSSAAGPSGCASRASPSRALGMNSSRASPSRGGAASSCGGSEGGGSGSPSRRPTSSRPASSTSCGTGH
ncbi:Cilia- and flagella-associated 57 [Chlorella sorokiniana]|uniref:tRNA (guanine-N(7)-)-methyltransferase n=1 Tax=Chlorella sorokiniana TaxID=3076 RepID=A0A2P6TUB7_CHLSO|nr:Cilia- and flagella-associated 57 [Chlorella sorokiniana]|eukprot:PRW57644.1 Cilia- and flagella-associated 57 [Chlorella sorokiniana]